MAPDVLKVAKPMMFGGTDPTLTHMGNPWLFRCRPNDSYSGPRDRRFRRQHAEEEQVGDRPLHRRVRHRRHEGARRGAGEARRRSRHWCRATPTRQPDFTPVVLAIKQSGADVIGSYFTYENDLAVFARQLRQLGITHPGSARRRSSRPRRSTWRADALFGTYAVADFVADCEPGSASVRRRSIEKRIQGQARRYSSWTYDGMNILCHAINEAGEHRCRRKSAPRSWRSRATRAPRANYNFDANRRRAARLQHRPQRKRQDRV